MKYRVRMSFTEHCYVERDFIVEADSPDDAKQKALLSENVIDEGHDHRCEPFGRDDIAIATDGHGKDHPAEAMAEM